MGYTTDFEGQFNLDKPLTEPQIAYLKQFAGTRRMKRDPLKAMELPDPLREAVRLRIGPEGSYFVGGKGPFGQDGDESVLDHNTPPGQPSYLAEDWAQPSLWCQWVPTDDGTAIVWDGGEKFYNYVEWLKYLIKHFLKPWGYTLNGEVKWIGEDSDSDRGLIFVKDNEVTTKRLKMVEVLDEDE